MKTAESFKLKKKLPKNKKAQSDRFSNFADFKNCYWT